MSTKAAKYEVSIECDYPQWWRYNVFMTVVGRDLQGQNVCYKSLIDRIYDIADQCDERQAPEGYTNQRPLTIIAEPCQWIEVYLYVIANTFPQSPIIRDSPSFTLQFIVRRDGIEIERTPMDVNQWGGTTLVGYQVGKSL